MKKKNFLLIDDNEMDNYISNYMISASKMAEKINVFTSPIEALEYLAILQSNHEEFPDFIFLDIRMPEMDGFGFLEEYSKFPEDIIKKSSIFMLTSSDHANDIKRALKYYFVRKYLVKPLTRDILNELI